MSVPAHTGPELACLDGAIGPSGETLVPVTDDGFIRGDGVFEVIRVYHGRAFALDAHLDRMERSAANLRLGWEVPRPHLEAEAVELLEARGAGGFEGCLRIVLTRGGRRLLLTERLPEGPTRPRLGFVTYAPTRVLDGVKSLSYAGNMLCGRLARERGFDEALMVTPHGRVLEAPTSTIFWAGADGRLATPPLTDHILASITRGLVLRLVGADERSLTVDELLGAGEAFLASTTREVQSLAGVEGTEWPEPGPRTAEAAAAVRAHIAGALG